MADNLTHFISEVQHAIHNGKRNAMNPPLINIPEIPSNQWGPSTITPQEKNRMGQQLKQVGGVSQTAQDPRLPGAF